MKRKLDDHDVPTVATPQGRQDTGVNFDSFGLDARLLQALAKENFSQPTLVQSKAVPLALEGKDILARAKTGSGKTAAYVLPILETILRKKAATPSSRATSALILVPTRELAEQVTKVLAAFSAFCAREVRSVNLTQETSETVQRSLLADCPDIVVATPARASQNFNCSALSLDHLTQLVIDESDLVLSYGYDEDIRNIATAVPHGIQTFLMSATLTAEVEELKGLFCRNPVILKLEESAEEKGGVSQFVVRCAEDDKFLLVYVIFKLKLVKGKCIIFVGDIDRCYRLKLFLEQFGTRSCVLNSELPVNSRIHVVEEFNKNVYDIIIASDEHEIVGPVGDSIHTKNPNSDEKENTKDTESRSTEPEEKRPKTTEKDKEYGISRGIDFKNVACILNFDLPTTSKSYTHRIGRTARAGKSGMALSFVVPSELYHKHKPTSFPSAQHDEAVLAQISKYQGKKGHEVKPYHFDMRQVDAFRYRMDGALRAVTATTIREARTRELRQELLQSEKLKRHFEENPEDLKHLRHDGELRTARVQPHLKHVPEYLMPNKAKGAIASGGDIGFVGMGKTSENRIRKARARNRMKRGGGRKGPGRGGDPLKTFSARGRR
ncbi:ATP-dependent DNA/RNA helicase [Loxospora ochrophaea]|nr:ATP-dependent DNA/RNA helicase [Loxospora ochrophaea]